MAELALFAHPYTGNDHVTMSVYWPKTGVLWAFTITSEIGMAGFFAPFTKFPLCQSYMCPSISHLRRRNGSYSTHIAIKKSKRPFSKQPKKRPFEFVQIPAKAHTTIKSACNGGSHPMQNCHAHEIHVCQPSNSQEILFGCGIVHAHPCCSATVLTNATVTVDRTVGRIASEKNGFDITTSFRSIPGALLLSIIFLHTPKLHANPLNLWSGNLRLKTRSLECRHIWEFPPDVLHLFVFVFFRNQLQILEPLLRMFQLELLNRDDASKSIKVIPTLHRRPSQTNRCIKTKRKR